MQTDTMSTDTFFPQLVNRTMLDLSAKTKLPEGFTSRTILEDSDGRITSMSWSPEGQRLCTCSTNESVALWNPELKKRYKRFEGHIRPVLCSAWNLDGRLIASGAQNIRLYESLKQEWIRTIPLDSEFVHSLAWSPRNPKILASGFNGRFCLWDAMLGSAVHTAIGRPGPVTGLAWSPDGNHLAATFGNEVWLYESESIKLIKKLCGHAARTLSVAWSPDGRLMATGSEDDTVSVWDIESWTRLAILEGQTNGIHRLSFSHDSAFLATGASDVRVWRCDTWEAVAVIKTSWSESEPAGLAFSPTRPILASVGKSGRFIEFWDLNTEQILKAKSALPTLRYSNAKVVLLGDTGVGKSGLGIVLTSRPFTATESTHARHVWTLDAHQIVLPDGRTESRELLLWDMAGQPGYRLIHQLHLNEVEVALIVFDARSETDPFSGVRHWDRALRQAQLLQPDANRLKKFLIAARIDRGRVGVGKHRIQSVVDNYGFHSFIETSARDGLNIDQLREAIRSAVDWDALPKVSSDEMFQKIKAFIVAEKDRGRTLTTTDDLFRSYTDLSGYKYVSERLRSQFLTCIGRVESRDLIKRLSFGNLILLKPEILDAYASAIVSEAKEEPDGLGCILEDDVKLGRFAISRDERLEDSAQESLLLIATIEDMIRHEIAFRESTHDGVHLVFPSQLTRENPDLPDPPGKAIVVSFEGPVVSAYATLCVRLSRSGLFGKRDMWKNAITFDTAVGGVCGLALRELEEGRGELSLFFDSKCTRETRGHFEKFILTHLNRWALPDSIKSKTLTACIKCGLPASEQLLAMLADQARDFFECPNCKCVVPIASHREASDMDETVMNNMDREADAKREAESAASVIQGKRATGIFDVFLCHNDHDKVAVKQIAQRLLDKGILPWLDVWELQPGMSWQRALERQIRSIKAAAVFIGRKGIGPWQNQEQEAFIREFVRRECPVIPTLLPNCIKKPDIPLFLSGNHWVNFKEISPDPVDQLIFGITGKRQS